MRTHGRWLQLLVAGAAAVCVTPLRAQDSTPTGSISACAMVISDVTGDGVRDFAVSMAAARSKSQLVYLLAGGAEPLPAELDAEYLRAHLAGILRGPAAAPFVCSGDEVDLEKRIGGAAKVRPNPLSANTLIGQPVPYRVVDLNALTPGGSTVASAINADGHVVGRFLTEQGLEHAFLYDGSVVRDLGTLGGHFSDAQGINRRGQVVGVSLTGATDSSGFVQSAFLADGVTMVSLNRDWSAAAAINDEGQIVGEMRVAPGVDLNHAFLFDRGAFTDLGSLPPRGASAHSTAHAINNKGQIVGQSNTFVNGVLFPDRRYDAVRPFLFENGALRDLGSLGARCVVFGTQEFCTERSVATDISNRGVIVGFSTTPATTSDHAFVVEGGRLRDLGVVDDNGQSWAYGVNNSGQIVGGYFDSSFRPFIVDNGEVYSLNDLIVNPADAAALPFAAYDINAFGVIAGNHHVLQPLYQLVQPGLPMAFTAALEKTFGVAFWMTRENVRGCRSGSSKVLVQVRFDIPGQEPGNWITADEVSTCGNSNNWRNVSASVPTALQGQSGIVRVRAREIGPDTGLTVYLRHFTMD
jgi:probable HAF family extracellular repeat protein